MAWLLSNLWTDLYDWLDGINQSMWFWWFDWYENLSPLVWRGMEGGP